MKLAGHVLPRSITAQITGIVAISVILGMAVTVPIILFLFLDL